MGRYFVLPPPHIDTFIVCVLRIPPKKEDFQRKASKSITYVTNLQKI